MQNILTVVFARVFPEDKLEQQHALFTQYKDPCRLGPGEDKPWALGNDTFAQISQKHQCHITVTCNHSATKLLQFYECLKIENILHAEL